MLPWNHLQFNRIRFEYVDRERRKHEIGDFFMENVWIDRSIVARRSVLVLLSNL